MLNNFREGRQGKGVIFTEQINRAHRVDETRLCGLYRKGIYYSRGRIHPNPAQPLNASLFEALEDRLAYEIFKLEAPNVIILKIHAGGLNGVKMATIELPFVVPKE